MTGRGWAARLPLGLAIRAIAVVAAACAGSTARAASDVEDRRLEALWISFEEQAARDPGAPARIVADLARRGDHEALEWLAIYADAPGALDALERAKAPQLVRTAVWRLGHPDSHTREQAKLALGRNAALALAWLERHPDAVRASVVPVLAELRRLAPPLVDPGAALPPLDPARVLAHLDAPADLLEVKPGVEPKVLILDRRYVHQVLRAIDGLVASGLHEAPWLAKLEALVSHPHATVRRRAALAFTRLPPVAIPLDRLLERAEDAGEKPEVREAALLGFSYGRHPRVHASLLNVARSPAHPAWKAAVSRLGDIGDGFAIVHLAPLREDDSLDAEARRFLDRELEEVRRRVAATTPERFAAELPVFLERAAWVDLGCDPLETTLVPFVLEAVRARKDDAPVRAALEGLRDGRPARLEVPGGAVEERVRDYARRVLEGE